MLDLSVGGGRETVVVLSLDAVGGAAEVSPSQGEFATEARLALH